MLVAFSVENYRCFRGRVTLDMRAPRGAAPGAKPWDGNLQSVAAVYGANASGKTALVRALRQMINDVDGSYRWQIAAADPYLFSEQSQRAPTSYSAQFIASDGTCYAYGYSVYNGAVATEWAERYTTARASMLFQRDGTTMQYGKSLIGPNKAVERTLRPDSLYLSAAIAAEHPGLAPLYGWLGSRALVYPMLGQNSDRANAIGDMADDPELRRRIGDFLRRADVGLAEIQVVSRRLTPQEMTVWMADRYPYDPDVVMMGRNGPEVEVTAFGSHAVDGQEYRLPLREESDGTRALIGHAYMADMALRTGSTVVFDELDASLHPLVVRELVRVFKDPQRNPNQAQLIFTTNDVSMMDSGYVDGSVLNRDEVWVVDKDGSGVSTLSPLAAKGARTRDNLASRYLAGRYGGVPAPQPLLDPVLL